VQCRTQKGIRKNKTWAHRPRLVLLHALLRAALHEDAAAAREVAPRLVAARLRRLVQQAHRRMREEFGELRGETLSSRSTAGEQRKGKVANDNVARSGAA